MKYLDQNKVAVTFALFLGGMHTAWAFFVSIGWAQMFLDTIFTLHSIAPVYTILPFDLGRSLMLVVTTSVLGYIYGYILAVIWNKLHQK